MDHKRKKLIEELIRVGRLIDPAPSVGPREDEDATDLPGITEESKLGGSVLAPDLEDLPVVDDVVDRPYATKDMFADSADNHISSTAKSLEIQQISANTSDSRIVKLSEPEGPATADPKKQQDGEPIAIRFPVSELARELVTLIEDRVSRRSGEQLDDAFRDELTQAVTAKLEGWLH